MEQRQREPEVRRVRVRVRQQRAERDASHAARDVLDGVRVHRCQGAR